MGSHCEFVNDGSTESSSVEPLPPDNTLEVEDINNSAGIETTSGTKTSVRALMGARIAFVATTVVAAVLT